MISRTNTVLAISKEIRYWLKQVSTQDILGILLGLRMALKIVKDMPLVDPKKSIRYRERNQTCE